MWDFACLAGDLQIHQFKGFRLSRHKFITDQSMQIFIENFRFFIRQILKDSLKKSTRNEPTDSHKSTRALVHVLAEAIGRTQNVSPENTEKLTKILLKKFDREVQ